MNSYLVYYVFLALLFVLLSDYTHFGQWETFKLDFCALLTYSVIL